MKRTMLTLVLAAALGAPAGAWAQGQTTPVEFVDVKDAVELVGGRYLPRGSLHTANPHRPRFKSLIALKKDLLPKLRGSQRDVAFR